VSAPAEGAVPQGRSDAGDDTLRESAPPSTPAPRSEPVPPAAAASETALPGAHRGGFQRLPTAPLPITSVSAPHDPDGEQPQPVMQWIMPEPARPSRGLAGWALAFAIVALIASLFVGWGFPLGIVAIVTAILALLRPLESVPVAVWAIALGAVSIVYSAGWLAFAGFTTGLFG